MDAINQINKANSLTLNVPSFDPADEKGDIEKYITELEKLAKARNWNEASLTFVATSNLKGLGKTWFDSFDGFDQTYEEWLVLFREIFARQYEGESLLLKMIKRAEMPNEGVLKYFCEKLELINKCQIIGENAVNLLLLGLKDADLQTAARAENYKTPSSLWLFVDSKSDRNVTEKQNKPAAVKEAAKDPSPSKTRSRAAKCFSCREFGHKAPQCPKKLRSMPDPWSMGNMGNMNMNNMGNPNQNMQNWQNVFEPSYEPPPYL